MDSVDTVSRPDGRTRALPSAGLIAGVTAALVMLALYLFWPYQHWQFATEKRGSVIEGWFRHTATNPELYFCYVVPFIVAFLVYRQRAEFAVLPVKGSWWGLAPAVVSVLCFWMGYKVDTGYLGFASFQLMTAALILLLGGPAWMRALFLPWLFLVFAWPMLPLESLVATPLRAFTAKLAGFILNHIGVPVVREGTGIYSAPDFEHHLQVGDRFRLDVANPCSGIRSLSSLAMISALYGVLALRRPLPRVLLFLSAVPLAVAGNLVRLILLALGSMWFGQDFAVGTLHDGVQVESFYHEIAGYIVFAVALSGMFALASSLEGRSHWKRAKLLEAAPPPAPRSAATGHGDVGAAIIHAVVALALGAATLVLCAWTPTTLKLAEPGLVMELPASVGSFQGGPDKEMDAREQQLFVEGVKLKRRIYIGPSNRYVVATLVMSGPAKKGLHEPSLCLPNQGWTISDTEEVAVKLDGGRVQPATLMHIYRDRLAESGVRVRERALNLYWYQGSHGLSTASYNVSHARTYLDSILRNLNHRWGQASFFMTVSQRPLGLEDPIAEEAAKEELFEFISKVTPKIVAPSAD
jgi:exosortase